MLPAENHRTTAHVAILHNHLARIDRARKFGFASSPLHADDAVPYLLVVAPVLKLLDHASELKMLNPTTARRWFLSFRSDLRRALFPTSMPPLIHPAAAQLPDIELLTLSTLNATSGLLARALIDDTMRVGEQPRQSFELALDCAGQAAIEVLSRCDEINTSQRRCVWQYVSVAGAAYH